MKDKASGQGLVEYQLILVLVAYVIIAILAVLGPQIPDKFDQIQPGIDVSSGVGYSEPLVEQLGDPFEAFFEFKELSIQQEENLDEVTLLFEEGAWEIIEVLIEYAAEIGDQVLYDLIYQVQQEIASGNYTNLFSLFSTITSDYGEIPQAVRVVVILKIEQLLINSYWALEVTQVPFEAYQAAVQEFEGMGGGDEAILILGEIWELVDQRNAFIQETRPGIYLTACSGINSLYNTGVQAYIDLADQFQTQIPPCNS